MKDKERSGRQPVVPKDVMLQIRQELADSNTGWDFFRQVVVLFTTKLESNIMKYIFTDCYTNGDSNLKYHKKRFVNTASAKEKKRFKKE